MKLQQIHMIRLQAAKRFVNLLGGGILCATVNLRHEEGTVSITVLLKCLSHSPFTLAVVVVPGVIHKVDSAVNAGVNQLDSIRFTEVGLPQVKTAHTDTGDFFTGMSQRAIGKVRFAGILA